MAANTLETELKVISWNINGLKEKKKDKEKFTQLQETFSHFDIVLLQETHLGKKSKTKKSSENATKEEGKDEEEQEQPENMGSSSESEDEEEQGESVILGEMRRIYKIETLQDKTCLEKSEFSGEKKMYLTYFDSKSRGVAILVNKPHNCLRAYCEGGDFAWVYIEIENLKYTFVSVYYHGKEKSDLMWRILTSFRTKGAEAWIESRLVIGGDFNTKLNPNLDLKAVKSRHSTTGKTMKDFMRIVHLVDVWRERNPGERKYTFSCNDPKSRLDYVFMLQNDLKNVRDCYIPEEQKFRDLSNHYPVVLTLSTDDSE